MCVCVLEINQFGFMTEVIVLIIGSLGNVHFRFVSGLMKCGLTKRESNSLSKYCRLVVLLDLPRYGKLDEG